MKVLLLLAIAPCLVLWSCKGSIQRTQLSPGFRGSGMEFVDNEGIFLLSNNSKFGFGFISSYSIDDTTTFLLSVIHLASHTTVWTANRGAPVGHSDEFAFDRDGNAYLKSGSVVIWSTNTSGNGAALMKLLDNGNLIILVGDSLLLWQSFNHPTDTLLSDQLFTEGMSLVSIPNGQGLSYRLQIESGDVKLLAALPSMQPYWSSERDMRIIKNMVSGGIHTAVLRSSSWNLYDKNGSLIRQLLVNEAGANANDTIVAVLDHFGFISFSLLTISDQMRPFSTKIPEDSCDTPEPCKPYFECLSGTTGSNCQCPTVLSSVFNCNPGIASSCGDPSASSELAKVDDGVGYFATDFVSPSAKTNLTGCKDACLGNCSCVALFHSESSGNCFLFDQIGSLKRIDKKGASYTCYVKVKGTGNGIQGSIGQGRSGSRTLLIVVIISVFTAAAIAALIYIALRLHRRKNIPGAASQESSDEDTLLECITGMPVRFSYRELQVATDNFTAKLGQGGFGSVYLGKLPDGSRVAVKKLESIGQGKKEFRSEVSIIGSIHHIHLVKLRGFCAEGVHRLLAYEYMAKSSLDRWIFQKNDQGFLLDWDKRYSIAVGTAKGLAYLHEDCESKIVHCDIKPENVLLDDNFHAKVSDFGLAKLMTREQSHVFTTLRGTRGYLAPEWITNYAISEKSDVYSYGMVLLEIIGGRKNFDPEYSSEKAHFPSYAFKKMEEGKLREIFDARLMSNDKDERIDIAIKVALWCVQEDLHLRPSMTKVVQMLEGLQEVPPPPQSSQLGFRLYANVFRAVTEEGTTTSSGSGPSDYNSDPFLSAVRLSGPRYSMT